MQGGRPKNGLPPSVLVRQIPATSYPLDTVFGLLLRRRQIRTTPMRHLRRHANALAQRRVRVDGFADVDRVGTHLNRQRNLADHVASMRADHAAAKDLAVAVGLR